MTPVSFVKTTESYEESFIMAMNPTRFAGWVTILIIRLLKWTEMGKLNYRIGSLVGCFGFIGPREREKEERKDR